MLSVIQKYKVMPDKGVEMTIALRGDGVADVNFHGRTTMPCWCGEQHIYLVHARLFCSADMDRIDMDDLDAAIRGVERAANRFAWRQVNRLFFAETPPCED